MSVLQSPKTSSNQLQKYSYQWITGGTNGNIYYSGNVGINTRRDPQYNLDVSGTSNISGNLFVLNVETRSINTTSDYRIKENPILLNDTFFVDSLKPLFYKNKISNREDMGFLAHEVQEIFPFLVNGEKDGDNYQSVNYNGFIALLVKEIQELKKNIDYLKKENIEIKIFIENILNNYENNKN
jgi:hypothetical protein